MNYYLIVEGKETEKNLYPYWISYVNTHLKQVFSISDFTEDSDNNYILFSGLGNPSYFEVIENGVYDVLENSNIDKLIIAIDAEDLSYEEKFQEINEFVLSIDNEVNYCVIVQNFCIETWLLGNKKIVGKNIKDLILCDYLKLFNVSVNDPENLPIGFGFSTKAQFAKSYLNKLLQNKDRNLSYKPNRINSICSEAYFKKIISRFESGHIQSFRSFLSAFQPN